MRSVATKWIRDLNIARAVIVAPEIADFEVRRELLRAGGRAGIKTTTRQSAKNRPGNVTPQVVWLNALTQPNEAQPIAGKVFRETPGNVWFLAGYRVVE